MNINFDNFIRFFKPDGQNRLDNWYEPRESMTEPLLAKDGDVWRFLLPKSDVGQNKLSDIRVDLWGLLPESCTESGIVSAGIGYVRRQQSELYYELVLKINSSPDGTWKQFAILRPNGAELFGTFDNQEMDFDKYCDAFQDFLESYPHTRVDVIRDGNLFKIRIWENGNFVIRNEKPTIGLGTVGVLNNNTPTLTKQFYETYTRAAYNTYDLVINDVTSGNIFSLNGVSYTATKSDTPETVKAKLLNGTTKVSFDVGSPINISASLGVTSTVNTNRPTIDKLYQETDTGQDIYRIEIGNIVKGNIFQVLISDASPIYVEVGEDDTVESIEAILNPNSGFLSVTSGATVTVNAVSGIRTDDNTNNPQIYVENGVLTPTAVCDKYKVFVGTSVKENNKFLLNDIVVIADSSDTYLTIADKLGLVNGIYEVAEGTTFPCYAQKGGLYNDSNIADVQLISTPIRRVSSQYLCEVTIPSNLSRNSKYQIALNKVALIEGVYEFVSTVAFSNFFEVESNPIETKLLRFADLGENFGFEYFEQGLSQQVRVPLFLKNEKSETSQVLRQSVNNATIKGQIEVRKRFDFGVKSFTSWFHRALNLAMNHEIVLIDGKKVSLINYEETDGVGTKQVKMASGSLYESQYLMSNTGKLWYDDSNYYEKITVKTNFNEKIIALIVYNNYFRKEITESGEIYLPVGEYKWKVFVAGGLGETTKMRIYQQGERVEEIILIGSCWNKSENIFRGYSGQSFIFEEINEPTTIKDLQTTLESTQSGEVSEFENEFGTIDDLNGKVTPVVIDEMTQVGQWRRAIDDDGNYVIEVLDENLDWITKYMLTE
jgi:hypothetical protein